jgi:hypothetical protein
MRRETNGKGFRVRPNLEIDLNLVTGSLTQIASRAGQATERRWKAERGLPSALAYPAAR